MPAASLRTSKRCIVILACCAFFLRFLALAAFAPYVALWLSQNGHTTMTYGAIYSIWRFTGMLAPMLLGALADARRCHREVFAIGACLNALAVLAMTLYPTSAFWQACCLFFAALCDASALLDAMVIRCLSWANASDLAPRTRALGALAWCAFAPCFGALSNTYGIAVVFWCYVPLLLLSLPVCMLLPTKHAYEAPLQQRKQEPPPPEGNHRTEVVGAADDTAASPDCLDASAAVAAPRNTCAVPAPATMAPAEPAGLSFGRRLRLILSTRRTLLLLLLFILIGVHFGVAFGYAFVYLESELHASGVQLGLTLTAQAILEV